MAANDLSLHIGSDVTSMDVLRISDVFISTSVSDTAYKLDVQRKEHEQTIKR